MPYLIHGPVPTEAIGDCPWCDKKNTVLHLTAAMIDGKLGGEYVCAKCLLNLDKMREKHLEKALVNNPCVEIEEYEPCSSYHIETGEPRCWGTKEMETCSCDGDKRKCDFYPYKREG